MSVQAPALAAAALRDWLLLKLPAKVTEVNAARAAVLRAPWAGPYDVPVAGTVLSIRRTYDSAAFEPVSITASTTAGIVTEINTALGVTVASADSEDRLVLTSLLAPTADVPSVLELKAGPGNSLFGFGKSGAKAMTTALVAPGYNDVLDGIPQATDFVSKGPGTIVVIIGDRKFNPLENHRRNEQLVQLDVAVFRAEPHMQVHRNREHIQAAAQCVFEVLLTDTGKQMGRASVGDIVMARQKGGSISGKPFSFGTKNSPGPLFDAAAFSLEVRVFERPA